MVQKASNGLCELGHGYVQRIYRKLVIHRAGLVRAGDAAPVTGEQPKDRKVCSDANRTSTAETGPIRRRRYIRHSADAHLPCLLAGRLLQSAVGFQDLRITHSRSHIHFRFSFARTRVGYSECHSAAQSQLKDSGLTLQPLPSLTHRYTSIGHDDRAQPPCWPSVWMALGPDDILYIGTYSDPAVQHSMNHNAANADATAMRMKRLLEP